MNLFAIAGHFVSYLLLSNWAAQLFSHTMKPVSSRLLVSPEYFAVRTKFFCRPHVCHRWFRGWCC